jgi:hypothetical protein
MLMGMEPVPLFERWPPGSELDLDAAAAEIEMRREAWSTAGFTVGELTWRDLAAGWPFPFVSRAEAREPDSVGVRCVSGLVEFSVVLFDGGWADVLCGNLETAEIESTAPTVVDVASFGRLLDDTFERWRREITT